MTDILTGKLNNYRDEFDNEFQHWYDFVVRIREDLGAEHSVPLLGKRCSRERSNLKNNVTISHYKRSSAIPFLDDIHIELSEILVY